MKNLRIILEMDIAMSDEESIRDIDIDVLIAENGKEGNYNVIKKTIHSVEDKNV